MRVIKSVAGRYEVLEVELGRVYRWCPGHVVVKCYCGEKSILTGSVTACECGVDHGPIVREELAAGRLGDEALHPWRYAVDRRDDGIPY